MDNQKGHVMTLANSIIGVSVLAMPYCFKQCGILLSILMLLVSSIISRLACHFLLKSAIIARRKTFEYLAFYIFGAMGKFAIEICIIGFLIGTCIAFFVVMGDLGPEIIAEITGTYTSNTMRTSILMALALFCVLPLGLLRNVDSLNGVSSATIGFYCCLVLKVIFEAIPHIFSGDWYGNVIFWRPAGILQCLPIFSMALFCQTQIFEIYQALQNATLEKMNNLVRIAVNICTLVYICVGVFGYIAFAQKPFTGNILLSFSPSFMTDVMKIGFVLSVAFSFPLVIFPCRASLYSLLYKEGYSIHEGMSNYIPEGKFKGLTMLIVFISLIIGIMIPNIELVLGLVGSTIGVMICVLFPVTCFICISPKNTNERILAQLMLMVGIFVMVLGTYKNLYTVDKLDINTVTMNSFKNINQLNLNVAKVEEAIENQKNVLDKLHHPTAKIVNINNLEKLKTEISVLKVTVDNKIDEDIKEIRHEPPQPIEPQEEINEVKEEKKQKVAPKIVTNLPIIKEEKDEHKPIENLIEMGKLPALDQKGTNNSLTEIKNDEVDIEAIKKEDNELQAQEKIKDDTNQVLIDTIQKQNEVQKEIVEQQKKLIEAIKKQQKKTEDSDIHKVNEEKLKAVKQIEDIALKAIQKISGDKNDKNLIPNLENNILLNNDKQDVVKDGELHNNLVNTGKKEFEAVGKSEISGKENVSIDLKRSILEQKNPIIENLNKTLELRNTINQTNTDLHADSKIENISPKTEIITDQKFLNVNYMPDKNKNEQISENLPKMIKKAPEAKINNAEMALKNLEQENQNLSLAMNNTAPLFLKLGKVDNQKNGPIKLVPLPIAMSKNFNNTNKAELSPNSERKNSNDILENNLNDIGVQAIKRDILSFTTKR